MTLSDKRPFSIRVMILKVELKKRVRVGRVVILLGLSQKFPGKLKIKKTENFFGKIDYFNSK